MKVIFTFAFYVASILILVLGFALCGCHVHLKDVHYHKCETCGQQVDHSESTGLDLLLEDLNDGED